MTQDSIIVALQGKALGAETLAGRENTLRGIIATVYQMKRQSISEEALDGEVRSFEPRLAADFRHLTLQEVRIALEAGICGEYGTATVPNVANFLQWVAIYSRSAERASAKETLARRNASLAARVSTIDRAEIDRKNAEALASSPAEAYATYCREGRRGFVFPQFLSRCVYDPLREKIANWWRTQQNRDVMKATIEADAARAFREFSKQNATLFRTDGVNAAGLEDFRKAEYVFRYFGNIKAQGATI